MSHLTQLVHTAMTANITSTPVTGNLTDKDIEAAEEDGIMGQNTIYAISKPG